MVNHVGEEPHFIASDSASASLQSDGKQCVCQRDQDTLCFVATSSTSVTFKRDADEEAWVGVVSPGQKPCAVFLSLFDSSVIAGPSDDIRPVNLSKIMKKPLEKVRVTLEEALGYVSFEFAGYHHRQELPKPAASSWSFVARLCTRGACVSVAAAHQSPKDTKNLQSSQNANAVQPRRLEVKTEIREASALPRGRRHAANEVARKANAEKRGVKHEVRQEVVDQVLNASDQIRREFKKVKLEVGSERANRVEPPRVELFEKSMFRGLRHARMNSEDELDAKYRIAAHVALVFQNFQKDVSLDQMQFAFTNEFLQVQSSTTRVDIFTAFSELCARLGHHGHKGKVVQIAYKFLTTIKEKRRHHFTWKEAVRYKSFCEEPDVSEPCGLWSAADGYSTPEEVGKRNRWRKFLRDWGEDVAMKLGHSDPEDLEADPSSDSSLSEECPEPVGYPVGTAPRRQKRKVPSSNSMGLVAALRRPQCRERSPRRRPTIIDADAALPEEAPASTSPRTPLRQGGPSVKMEVLEQKCITKASQGTPAKQSVQPASLRPMESPEKLRSTRTNLQQVKAESTPFDPSTMHHASYLSPDAPSELPQEHSDFSDAETQLSSKLPIKEDQVEYWEMRVLEDQAEKETSDEAQDALKALEQTLEARCRDLENSFQSDQAAMPSPNALTAALLSALPPLPVFPGIPPPPMQAASKAPEFAPVGNDPEFEIVDPECEMANPRTQVAAPQAPKFAPPVGNDAEFELVEIEPAPQAKDLVPLRCGESFTKDELVDHKANTSPKRLVLCPLGCGCEGPSHMLDLHIAKYCPKRKTHEDALAQGRSFKEMMLPQPPFLRVSPATQVPATMEDFQVEASGGNVSIVVPPQPIFVEIPPAAHMPAVAEARSVEVWEERPQSASSAPEISAPTDDWGSVLDMLQGLGGESSGEYTTASTPSLNWQTLQEGEWKALPKTDSGAPLQVMESPKEVTPWREVWAMPEATSWWPEAAHLQSVPSSQRLNSQIAPPTSSEDLVVENLEKVVQEFEEELEAPTESEAQSQYAPTESPDSNASSDTEFVESVPVSPGCPSQEPSEPEPESIDRSNENTGSEMLQERWQKLSQLWNQQVQHQAQQPVDADLERRLWS